MPKYSSVYSSNQIFNNSQIVQSFQGDQGSDAWKIIPNNILQIDGIDEKPHFLDHHDIFNSESMRSKFNNAQDVDVVLGGMISYCFVDSILAEMREKLNEQAENIYLLSDVKSLEGVYEKLFNRGKELTDIVRCIYTAPKPDKFWEWLQEAKEAEPNLSFYIKPPNDNEIWSVMKVLIYRKDRSLNTILGLDPNLPIYLPIEVQLQNLGATIWYRSSSLHTIYEELRSLEGNNARGKEIKDKFDLSKVSFLEPNWHSDNPNHAQSDPAIQASDAQGDNSANPAPSTQSNNSALRTSQELPTFPTLEQCWDSLIDLKNRASNCVKLLASLDDQNHTNRFRGLPLFCCVTANTDTIKRKLNAPNPINTITPEESKLISTSEFCLKNEEFNWVWLDARWTTFSCVPNNRFRPYLHKGTLVTGDSQWVWMQTASALTEGCKVRFRASLGLNDVTGLRVAVCSEKAGLDNPGTYSMILRMKQNQWVADYSAKSSENGTVSNYPERKEGPRTTFTVTIELSINTDNVEWQVIEGSTLRDIQHRGNQPIAQLTCNPRPVRGNLQWIGIGQEQPNFGVKWRGVEVIRGDLPIPPPDLDEIAKKAKEANRHPNPVEPSVRPLTPPPQHERRASAIALSVRVPLQLNLLDLPPSDCVYYLRKIFSGIGDLERNAGENTPLKKLFRRSRIKEFNLQLSEVAGLSNILNQMLIEYINDEVVVGNICDLIRVVRTDDTDEQFGECGACDTLTKAFKVHLKKPRLVNQIAKAMNSMTINCGNQALFAEAHACIQISEAIKFHYANVGTYREPNNEAIMLIKELVRPVKNLTYIDGNIKDCLESELDKIYIRMMSNELFSLDKEFCRRIITAFSCFSKYARRTKDMEDRFSDYISRWRTGTTTR